MRNAAFYMGGDFVPNLKNNNKTYQFITAMQGIKLQDCEQRRRWEWEDVQAELFEANMKNLKLQQTQEAGSIFINEIKNRKRKDDHHQIAVGLLQGIGRRNLHRRHRSQPVQPKIDKERLAEAARIANINDYIMRLPLKYNTLIGQDGVGLSQGQKQRILIARAVYKNPQYIFLDEATNALDANNERIIVENHGVLQRENGDRGGPSPKHCKERRPDSSDRQRENHRSRKASGTDSQPGSLL